MTQHPEVSARIAILLDPAGTSRGVGPDAVEGLLTTWANTPVALGHREDGSPYPIGIEGKHLSLGHAKRMTAVALADAPVGIDISSVGASAADRKVAAKLFTSSEKTWLNAQPRTSEALAFATLWTLKEALLKRELQGLGSHDLPDVGVLVMKLSGSAEAQPIDWRPWMAIAASSRVPAGLMLGLPLPLLRPLNAGTASSAILRTPVGLIALAVAWTTH